MNGGRGPAPTRYNLVRARRRLERVEKGSDLLSRKRRALVAELFRAAAPAAEAREELASLAERAYPALLEALGAEGAAALRALGWPGRRVEVEVRPVEVWGLELAEIERLSPVRRSLPARGTAPGPTGPAAVAATDAFEALVELLLDSASHELLVRRLAEGLARTTRQLNTLDQRVEPELEEQIRETERVLEEREREEVLRIRHVMRRGGRPGRRQPASGPSSGAGSASGSSSSATELTQ